MAIINPDHLLDQAIKLLGSRQSGFVRQADIRRAYSAAYYALFHAILNLATDEIVGSTNRPLPRWGLVCRSVSHRWMRELCEALTKTNLPKRFAAYVPREGFGSDLEIIATVFIDLQEKRMAADYDPMPLFLRSDAEASVEAARTAVAKLGSVNTLAKEAFSYLVLFPPRSQSGS